MMAGAIPEHNVRRERPFFFPLDMGQAVRKVKCEPASWEEASERVAYHAEYRLLRHLLEQFF